MGKRVHHEEHENHERWLVSYADFITLLFAFFVVMYAVSAVDQKRVVELERSVRFAMHFQGTGGLAEMPLFKGPPSGGNCMTTLGKGKTWNIRDRLEVETKRRRVERALKPFLLKPTSSKPVIVIETDGRRLLIRMAATQIFDPASAVLRPEAMPVLDAIMGELAPLGKPIRIEGHTDNSRIRSSIIKSNWDLSALRAASVVNYIEKAHRIPKDLLSVGGYGESRPIGTNKTEEGREINRRIDIKVEIKPGSGGNVF